MILNSFGFILLLPAVVVTYVTVMWLCRRSPRRNVVSAALLTILSYTFFIIHQPAGAAVLAAITLLTYLFALAMERRRLSGKAGMPALMAAAMSTIVLAPLLVLKYHNFIQSSLSGLLAALGIVYEPQHVSFIIPLGISFFTFQAIGYMWDVYRGRIAAERNLLFYTLFVGFFPQIASGPISKADELLPQIKKSPALSAANIAEGARLMLWGYFLKAVVADRLATVVDAVYPYYEFFSGLTCLAASIVYSLQIYGDFAGYSLIAIGVGRLFGYDLINNFRRPYLAHSVTEFWRRWHISLTRWLKDYVYIPLGGNRRGTARTYGNIMATFLVSGLWHGANITFLVWGLVHGLAQCGERLMRLGGRPDRPWVMALRVAVTFTIVNFAWIFFRMPALDDAIGMITRILTFAPGESLTLTNSSLALTAFAVTVMIAADVAAEFKPGVRLLRHRRLRVRMAALLCLLFVIIMTGVLDAGQFIYVNF